MGSVLNPAIARKLAAQRSAARADSPPADELEVLRLIERAMGGERVAAEEIIRRISSPTVEHEAALAHGLVRAWLVQDNAPGVDELCDRYAQLFNFDQADPYLQARAGGLADQCLGYAAAAVIAHLRDTRPPADELRTISLGLLFRPFCDVAGQAVGFPDGRYRALKTWLWEIGLPADRPDTAQGRLDLLIRDAFTKIDFFGSLPSNRQQVMLGPFGAHIAARLAIDPLGVMDSWQKPGKRPQTVNKQQADRFLNLVDVELGG